MEVAASHRHTVTQAHAVLISVHTEPLLSILHYHRFIGRAKLEGTTHALAPLDYKTQRGSAHLASHA